MKVAPQAASFFGQGAGPSSGGVLPPTWAHTAEAEALFREARRRRRNRRLVCLGATLLVLGAVLGGLLRCEPAAKPPHRSPSSTTHSSSKTGLTSGNAVFSRSPLRARGAPDGTALRPRQWARPSTPSSGLGQIPRFSLATAEADSRVTLGPPPVRALRSRQARASSWRAMVGCILSSGKPAGFVR